jgi:hypothetical protein
MSPVITIPLEKNDEIAALVADMQPGQKIYGCFSIKSKDAQTLNLRIEEITDNKEDLPDKSDYDEDEDEEGDDDDSIEEEDSNGSSPSETDEAIRLASPGGYMGP